jgi:hypothetical protein
MSCCSAAPHGPRQAARVTGIVGETDAMIETLERVVQIAPVSSTVLLTGESGTGKERVARGIHALSPRRHRPFIATNVAALPETLLEAELFGHEKGAFTGAIGQRKGFFELAHRGTLFLDEIGEMPLATQTKLLRALEEQRFRRLGGEVEIEVDVRVIAATNQPLRQLVEVGRFRRDLYFRLNVLHIELPPLRERRADIPLLIDASSARPARARPAAHRRLARGHVDPHRLRLARQRARAAQPRRVDGRALAGPRHPAEDIPPEIRDARGRSRLLPVPIRGPHPGPVPPRPSSSSSSTRSSSCASMSRTCAASSRTTAGAIPRSSSAFGGYPLPPLASYFPSLPLSVGTCPPRHIEDVEPEPSRRGPRGRARRRRTSAPA